MTENTSGKIEQVPLRDALGERYLSYALSTIMSRSLPDVRDGLKPVHRRLLFAMRELGLSPKKSPKKSARVVGDVIGKYHPHGDTAVYDALVRLAQDFSVRFPLIDGQGNFGNIDGDNAAAMRYTEARLTEVALALLEGIDEDAVDFRETYDNEGAEPVVLPANFPHLLANGATGIAVGMATSVPPHNVGELCDGLLHLIKFPNAGHEKLIDLIPGPDLPTGGTIVDDRADIVKAYETGRGSFKVQAKWEVEQLGNGQYKIIVTEIPYQVQKSRLIERIANLLHEKKLPLLNDIRDESAEDIRLVLVPKSRAVDPETLMSSLFQVTELESRTSLNLNVLDGTGVPRVMSLREALQAFLDHRHEVLVRRSQYRLQKILDRLEIVDGLLTAFLNLDRVIQIIREEDEPKPIMSAEFGLTDMQAEAILNMRLRSLRKLEEETLSAEKSTLEEERDGLRELLQSEELRWSTIADQVKETKQKFGQKTELGQRRTAFGEALAPVNPEDFIEKEPLTIICSEKGWIRAMKGHVKETEDFKYKEGDQGQFVLYGYTTDKVLVFTDEGRFYTLEAAKLPGGRGFGEPLNLMVDLEKQNPITMHIYNAEEKMIVAAESGRGFIVEMKSVIASTRTGKQTLNLPEGEKAHSAKKLQGDMVAVIGTNRKFLVFEASELPVMSRGKGVRLQKYKEAKLSDVTSFDMEEGISWQQKTQTRTESDIRPWFGKRASVGKLPPIGFPRTNRFD